MLQSAVIEVRQHLCCANVFLKFKQSLNDSGSLKIIVDETKIKLQSLKCSAEIIVSQFLILPETFSNLIVDAENASFRISVKNIQLSGFYEYAKRDCLQINLTEEDEASVICSNCDSILVAQQKYGKIREFPSGAIDVNDFFCHHGPNLQEVLVPLQTDLFYGFEFIVINRTNIEKSIREKENHIYCRRCLRYFGETMLNCRAAKLWSDSIRFKTKGQTLEIFCLDGKSQIYKLLIKVIEETSLPSPEPLLRNMHFTKVLLKTFSCNRQPQYLLLNILEKHLPVLINKENFLCYKDLSEGNQNTRFELRQQKAFKMLYRLIANDEDGKTTSWPPILEYWQQDINILKLQISPFLFGDVYKELSKNIKALPEIYRVNNDDFLLGYIFY